MREADLLREVRDLPVVVRVGETIAGVFGVGEPEQVSKTRKQRAGGHRRNPAEGGAGGDFRCRRSLGGFIRFGLSVELVLVGQDPREQAHYAVAASAATCSCERATSSTLRSSTSTWRSQSKRRAHSKARSPVAWFASLSSSSSMRPCA